MAQPAIAGWLQQPDTENTTRVERRRSRKVNEIMALTAEVIAERGYHGTNLEEIADRLDVSKASIYHYFDGKEPLVKATLEACHTHVSRQLRETATQDGTPAERLERLVRKQLEIITGEDAQASRLFLQPLDWPPDLGEAVVGWQREHGHIFLDVIDDGIRSGEFTCPDVRVANMTIQGAINLVPSWYRRHPSTAARSDLIDKLVVTLLRVVGIF
jgi:TetR/AcrR family transcriptional regulator, regulator of autoinduction and epiphytic fitness